MYLYFSFSHLKIDDLKYNFSIKYIQVVDFKWITFFGYCIFIIYVYLFYFGSSNVDTELFVTLEGWCLCQYLKGWHGSFLIHALTAAIRMHHI